MLWHAMPPEVNTARLMAGAGPAPMLQAAAGWAALAAALDAQAAQLGTILASLSGVWTGASGERAVAAATPMVAWLQDVALQARQRGLQAAAQAAAYTTALATTPSLPEIAANHVTNAALVATNFLGINAVPIAANEADYFVRMWNQAAIAMDVYQAQTVANTMFAPLPPMKPIVVPEVGEAVQAQALGMLAEMSGKTAPELLALAEAPAPAPDAGFGIGQPALQFLTQIGQLAGPMQQLTGMAAQFGGTGGGATPGDADARRGENAPQTGLLGANPLSSHPLTGGSGPSSGAGLLRAGSLPGAGGSGPRTPVLAQMLDTSAGSPVPTAPADAGGAGGAKSSATGGGAVPLGAMGAGGAQGATSGATRAGLVAAVPLTVDQDGDGRDLLDEGDDW